MVFEMKEYDAIIIGTGSAMNIIDTMIRSNPNSRIAVIDKDKPRGICLTRGCIPSKILLYPAELIRTIDKVSDFDIGVDLKKIDFDTIMSRMRTLINSEIAAIERGLSSSENIDYFREISEFTSPYMLKVGEDTIRSNFIILCTGSKPYIPQIKGLEKTVYLTSDMLLELDKMPRSLAIVGGGYIAAEYGHFFSSMGSKVTIIGRNPQFLPEEDPEISSLAKRELEAHMTVLTNYEVREVKSQDGLKKLITHHMETGNKHEISAEEILIATGRAPNTAILGADKGA